MLEDREIFHVRATVLRVLSQKYRRYVSRVSLLCSSICYAYVSVVRKQNLLAFSADSFVYIIDCSMRFRHLILRNLTSQLMQRTAPSQGYI